jgi:hypothetical protein
MEMVICRSNERNMEIGMKIAENHLLLSKKVAELNGGWSQDAVNGCVVWLAAEIMKALDAGEVSARGLE